MGMKRLPGAVMALAFSGLAGGGLAAPASASTFHLMQIEQVTGGVGNDPAAQAIQLRMRAPFQNLLGGSRLIVRDATGSNPITIIDFNSSVLNGSTGARVLVASAAFVPQMNPVAIPNFQMTNLIPECYFRAGTLTFESDAGIIYWRLSWGGSNYTGPNSGNIANDPDGNFGPPFPGPLSFRALRFQGSATATSTNNAADYAYVPGTSTWTNNSGSSGVVKAACPGDIDPATGNGVVNISDLLKLLSNWGPCPPTCPPVCDSDLNADGVVNIQDLLDLLGGWGACPS